MKKLFMCLITLAVIINLFYFHIAVAQENILTTKSFYTKIELKKFLLIKELKNEADNAIFKEAIEKVEWFVNQFYDRRADEDFIKVQMETYLISNDAINEFLFLAAEKIDFTIKKIILEYCKDKLKINIPAEKLKNIDYNLDPLKVLKEYMPNADNMINSIYGEMEQKNFNAEQKSYLLKQFETISTKYPKTTLSATAFVVISGTILAYGLLPATAATNIFITILGKGISAIAWFGLTQESVFNYEKLQYKNALDTGIRNRRKEYNKALEKITSDIIGSVINTLPTIDIQFAPVKKENNIVIDKNRL